MEERREIIKTQLSGGAVVSVEVRVIGGEENVAATLPSFDTVRATIEAIAQELQETLTRIRPTKATAEFGIELALEAGKLTALLTQSSAKATLKIVLEWSGSRGQD